MDKMTFNSVGQFLIALEKGRLYDENGNKYMLRTSHFTDNLSVEEHDKVGVCIGDNNDLLSIQKIVINNTFTRQAPIPDKSLVWGWDYDNSTRRSACFYDSKNHRTFSSDGSRSSFAYDHYQVIEPNDEGVYESPFEWANEAVKKLAD